MKEDVLALAEELDGVSVKENCEACLASGTELCRGDLECAESAHKACAKRLRAIAEHDADDVTTVSAYDLLPDEDRKAISWVREHGGIERCEAFVHQGTREHGYLLKIAEMLGTSIYDGSDNADALLEKLSERLMPEGMEWPKVDGKPVDFKTAYGPSLGALEAVSIYSTGACQVMSHDGIIKSAKDIHIVKPKVLDADGVEIREGDVLYSVETGDYVVVDSIEPGNPWFATTDGALQHCAKFTHRAPVLASDGEPLEVGQTVWDENGDELVVAAFEDGGHTVYCRYVDVGDGIPVHGMWSPSDLTHQRPVLDADGVSIKVGDTVWRLTDGKEHKVTGINPQFGDIRVKDESMELGVWDSADGFTHTKPEIDTWQRIEEDARGLDSGVDRELFSHTHEYIVRRCRALADREGGE